MIYFRENWVIQNSTGRGTDVKIGKYKGQGRRNSGHKQIGGMRVDVVH